MLNRDVIIVRLIANYVLFDVDIKIFFVRSIQLQIFHSNLAACLFQLLEEEKYSQIIIHVK